MQNRTNTADNLSAVNGDPLHPRYDNNRFGGSLGGLSKNKLFFYGLYEYNPVGRSSSAGQLCAPAAGWSTISAMSGATGFSQTSFNQHETVSWHRRIGRCPLTTPNGNTGTGNLSLGNQRPALSRPKSAAMRPRRLPANHEWRRGFNIWKGQLTPIHFSACSGFVDARPPRPADLLSDCPFQQLPVRSANTTPSLRR
jgi:hypothetical protein